MYHKLLRLCATMTLFVISETSSDQEKHQRLRASSLSAASEAWPLRQTKTVIIWQRRKIGFTFTATMLPTMDGGPFQSGGAQVHVRKSIESCRCLNWQLWRRKHWIWRHYLYPIWRSKSVVLNLLILAGPFWCCQSSGGPLKFKL